MGHVVLLGDSIFDNAAYVLPGEPDVARQVQAKLPNDWRATLCAVDGAVTLDVEHQLRNIPTDASHLIASVGGNDALGEAYVLTEKVGSVAEAMLRLSFIRDEFARRYKAMLDVVMERQLPTAICTIFDGAADDQTQQRVNTTALTVFNDVITREAFRRGLTLIDLRLICDQPDDYANPIEPSAQGGSKIAAVIAEMVVGKNISSRSQVYAH